MNKKTITITVATMLAVAGLTSVFLFTGPTNVPVGANLQDYINAASSGNTLQLANATYVGNFTENKGLTILGPAVLKGAIHATPTIIYPPGTPPATLKNLEITTADTGQIYAIVEYGSGGADQNTIDKQPQGLTMDSVWVHGQTTQEVQRCVAANGRNFKFINGRATDCHGKGYDSQAIACWNGSGPFVITDSVLEGAGENVMFGGSPPSIPNLVHTGVEFRRNKVSKPLSWRGVWTVKNLFELKNARNVVVDGNVFDGNWTDAQAGRGIVFTPRPSDSGPAAVVEDVQFTNNVVRNTGSGVLILGMDEVPQPQVTTLRRLRMYNNLILVDGPQFGSNGACWTVINATEDVTLDRNTCIQTQHIIVADYAPNIRFTFTNNVVRHNDYGIFGSGSGIGNVSIAQYFPGSTITGNVIIKEFNTPSTVESLYPAGNQYVATTGMAVGTDFRSLIAGAGADIDAIKAAQSAGSPSPTTTPTAVPTTSPTATPTPSGESPSNTRIPPAAQIVDSVNAVWTRAANGAILRNGVSAQGGVGSVILYCNRKVYVFGTDSVWYLWDNGWTRLNATDPCGAPSPSPTQTPSATATPTSTPTPTPTSSPTPQPCQTTTWPNSIQGQNSQMQTRRAQGCYPVNRPNNNVMEYARP